VTARLMDAVVKSLFGADHLVLASPFNKTAATEQHDAYEVDQAFSNLKVERLQGCLELCPLSRTLLRML
jgi:hypothetical protein